MKKWIESQTHREERWINSEKRMRTTFLGYDSAEIAILNFAKDWFHRWKDKKFSDFLVEEAGWSRIWADEVDEVFFRKVAYDLVLNDHDVPRVHLAIQRQGLDPTVYIWPK